MYLFDSNAISELRKAKSGKANKREDQEAIIPATALVHRFSF